MLIKMMQVMCLLLLSITAHAALVKGSLRQRTMADGFVNALEFKHRLRICNAYPFSSALDVYNGRERLNDAPLPYKSCKDFASQLKAGDKLEFKVGDANAGTFSVSDLPNNDAVLLLVIHRHDTLSTAVSFESHVFANLLNAQVAVIDTYKGIAKSIPKIKDATTKADKASRSEELRYNSVVAVNPGIYDVELRSPDDTVKSKNQLVALNRESYLIVRTGIEAQQGKSYPEELLVYPKSDPALLRSASTSHNMLTALVVAFLVAIAW
jgi:hypothetical protein